MFSFIRSRQSKQAKLTFQTLVDRFVAIQSHRQKAKESELHQSEALEIREVLAAPTLTANEQLMLELINRARADPSTEAALHGVGLNDGVQQPITTDAKQPLAPNAMLQIASDLHSLDMLTNNFFDHINLSNQDPVQRATAQGYPTQTVGENLSWGGSTGPIDQEQHVYDRHMRLFQSPGHRFNMLFYEWNEVGVSVEYGQFTDGTPETTYNASMVTNKFGVDLGVTTSYITGVAFTDALSGSDDNDFYDIGEGVSGTIRIVDVNSQQEYTDGIGAAGGYGIRVPDGTYDVYATINGVNYIVENVVVSGENVKVDFETTTATPFVLNENGQLFSQDSDDGSWTVLTPDGSNSFNVNTNSDWSSAVNWVYQNTGDFNGDGYIDVIAMDEANGEWYVSTGNFDGSLNTPTLWTTWLIDPSYNTPLIGDVNGDGYDDLLARQAGGNGRWYIAYSNASGFGVPGFSAQWNPNISWINIAVNDFNNDGKDDVIGQQSTTGTWYIAFANASGIGFGFAVSANNWNLNANWSDALYGDFNGDGYTDFAGYQNTSGDLYVMRNNSGTSFSAIVWQSFSTSMVWTNWHAGDFNGDGKDDILAQSESTGEIYVALSNSGGTALDPETVWATFSPGTDWVDYQIGDFDGDGNDDIAARDNDTGEWTVALSNGSTAFTLSASPWATYNPADNWDFVGSVNTQSYPFNPLPGEQIFAQDASSADWTSLTPNGSNSFDVNTNSTWNSAVNWVYQNVGDFNGSGYNDVIAMDEANGEWYVSTGNSDGSLNAPTLWTTWLVPASYNAPQVGDVNNDGLDDLITRDATGTGRFSISYSNGGGFGTPTLSAPWNPSITWDNIRVADFNNDGKADVAGRQASTGNWFVSLANTSGIGFNYASMIANWSASTNWAEAEVGDFNGDGYNDILAHNLDTGDLIAYLNPGLGGGAYTPATWQALATATTWVDTETGDFNGDGKADLLTRDQATGNINVLLANAGGTGFEPETVWVTFATSSTWVDFQVGDFDGDGNDDIAARDDTTGEWTVALSNGSTAFTPSGSPWATFNPADSFDFVGMLDSPGYPFNPLVGEQIFAQDASSADWTTLTPDGSNSFDVNTNSDWSSAVNWVYQNTGDFNGDGYIDVIAMDEANGEWYVSTGNFDGSLNTPTLWTTWLIDPSYNTPLIGDVNGDGYDDLLARQAGGNGRWYIAYSNASGFGVPGFSAQWNPNISWINIAVNDFNNDGKDDVIGQQSTTGTWYIAFANASGIGFGFAVSANNWNLNANWSDALYGDFNGDGYTDFAGYQNTSGDLYVMRNNSGTSFSAIVWQSFSTSMVWTNWHAGDFNGDGKDDILAQSESTGEIYVALSNSGGTALDPETVWATFSPGTDWVDYQIGDFDGDGNDDIAARDNDTGEWTVALSNGSTAFTLSASPWATYNPADNWDFVGSVNTQSYPFNPLPGEQIFAQDASSADWTSLTPNGSNSFDVNTNSTWNSAVNWVYQNVGDFNGSGYNDVIAMDEANGEWYVSTGNSDGSLNAPTLWTTWLVPASYNAPQVGDVNNDGLDDLITRDATGTGRFSISYSNGGGFGTPTLSAPWNPSITWDNIRVADFNNDGKADVAGRQASTGNWFVSLANTSGIGFNYASMIANWSASTNWAEAEVGDFNGDGYNDILAHNLDTGDLIAYLNPGLGGGAYTPATWQALATATTWVDTETGDFNGDGKADLLTRDQATGNINVLLANAGGTGFEPETVWVTFATSSTWVDFQVGDFDGDGNDDIAARDDTTGEWTVALSNGSTAFTPSGSPWATFNPADSFDFVGMNNTHTPPQSVFNTLAFFPASFSSSTPDDSDSESDSTLFTAIEDSGSDSSGSTTESLELVTGSSQTEKSEESSQWDAFENIGELLF